MTPAIDALKKAGMVFRIHEYQHDPQNRSYGEEAATMLGIDGHRVFKTLILSQDHHNFYVAVLPVACQLDLKHFAKIVGAKKIALTDKSAAQRMTGYIPGGVSPIGQKRTLPTIIDRTATDFDTIFVSAGRRGLEIELSPDDLCILTRARFETIGH